MRHESEALRRYAAVLEAMAPLTAATSNASSKGFRKTMSGLAPVSLSDGIASILGAFRSSGRFFWPVGYALAAGSIVLTLRRFRPAVSLTVLAIAGILLLIDVEPLREALAQNARHSVPPVFNRNAATAIVSQAHAVMIFPSFGCVDDEVELGSVPRSLRPKLRQANMELQFIAARFNLPINSVYNTRLKADCTAEDDSEVQKIRRGTLYVYLTGFTPTIEQLDGFSSDDVCSTLDRLHYCLIPDAAVRR